MTNWTGKWRTNFGELTLKENGNTVMGNYSNKGLINGKIIQNGTENILEGLFTNDSRQGFFKFIKNGNSFEGKWKWETDTNWNSTAWNGERSIHIDGVFEGGGTLGTAYIGSLRALEENNIWFKTVSGNSAGAITAALIAVGYTAKEIQWLSSPNSISRPSTLPNSVSSIKFSSFLDFPKNASDISNTNKKRTYLWKTLKGEALDSFKKLEIKGFPTREITSEKISTAILQIIPDRTPYRGIRRMIKNTIETSLFFLPRNTPDIGDYIPFNSTNLREKLANTVWKNVVNKQGSYRVLTNLIYEGGMCEGDKFLKTMKELLSAKLHNGNVNIDIKFSDLKYPLALIATDTKNKKMIVYSSKKTPEKSVAEAVRESMSIPFIFEPMGRNEIVDGGLCSNYPYWIYSELDSKYFSSSDIDINRVKIGFKLDDNAIAKRRWNLSLPKYTKNNSTARKPLGVEVLSDYLAYNRFNYKISNNSELGIHLKLLSNVFEVSSKDHLHDFISKKLMGDRIFYEVTIPLKGYHWLDFLISENQQHFSSITQRGWYSTIDILEKNNLIESSSNRVCPL